MDGGNLSVLVWNGISDEAGVRIEPTVAYVASKWYLLEVFYGLYEGVRTCPVSYVCVANFVMFAER